MKHLITSSLILILLCACEKQKEPEYMPQWLKTKVQEMEGKYSYVGTTLYRYRWNSAYYFEFSIPFSSCMYCDIYTITGTRVNWEGDMIENYLEQRFDKTFLWSYPNE
jgi:hypothetical protein